MQKKKKIVTKKYLQQYKNCCKVVTESFDATYKLQGIYLVLGRRKQLLSHFHLGSQLEKENKNLG